MPWPPYNRFGFLQQLQRELPISEPLLVSSDIHGWAKSFSWVGIGFSLVLLLLELLQGMDIAASLAGNKIQSDTVTALAIRSQTLLERDAKLLTEKALGRMNLALDPIFAGYHQRVPDFAAWAFQWRTSYSFIRRGVITAVILPFSDSPQLGHFGAAWNDLIAEKFEELVIRPNGGSAALSIARSRWEQEIYTDLKVTITNTVLMAALLRGQDLTTWSWQPLANEASNVNNNDAMLFSDALNAATSPIKVHAIRPIITRLTMRPPIAAAVTLTGEAISSYGDFGFFGTVAGMAATMAGFLSVDYLISRMDAAISQQDLEVEVHRAIDAEYEQVRLAWLATVEANINLQISNANNMLNEMHP